MAGTRERSLAAAVELVGDEGLRALTHARVDERAGLPRGSTSNWFRSRAALVDGVISWIAESERADFAGDPGTSSPSEFMAAFTGMIEAQTEAHATRTRARFALFLDAGGDALTPLHDQRVVFEEWMRGVAERLAMPDPEASARTLMACADGLVMHRLTVDPGAPVRPVVERAVAGCLHPDSAMMRPISSIVITDGANMGL